MTKCGDSNQGVLMKPYSLSTSLSVIISVFSQCFSIWKHTQHTSFYHYNYKYIDLNIFWIENASIYYFVSLLHVYLNIFIFENVFNKFITTIIILCIPEHFLVSHIAQISGPKLSLMSKWCSIITLTLGKCWDDTEHVCYLVWKCIHHLALSLQWNLRKPKF